MQILNILNNVCNTNRWETYSINNISDNICTCNNIIIIINNTIITINIIKNVIITEIH